jgi:carbonic anhydrase/acetyltransferase-like protein (isoleucine patch superfamily)
VTLIVPFQGKTPKIADDVFIAPTAVIIGDVEIGAGSSVWFGVVIRGDVEAIRIGSRTNVQENVVIHADPGKPAIVGDEVTLGHGAIVHGCTVASRAQIGMGAVVLNGAVVGSGTLIGAGAVVAEGAEIPPGSVALGVPAKVRRESTPEERQGLLRSAETYYQRGRAMRAVLDEEQGRRL